MRRKVSALLTVALAMLLSLVLAVPASADASSDFWANYNAQLKTTAGGNYQYKYGFDYRQQEWRQTAAGQQAINSMTKPIQPVSPTVNPSSNGASYYLNQYRNRTLNPANIPLEGKIIEPGKTVVRPPSTYTPTTRFQAPLMGGGFLSVLMGSIGLGMGGTATPPANWQEVARNQGISQGCVDNVKNCVGDETGRLLAVTGCGNLGTCNNIGAVSGDEPREAVPLLDKLWAIASGQEAAKEEQIPSDSHIEVSPMGCKKEIGIQYRGENNITLYARAIEVKARPGNWALASYYDEYCSPAAQAAPLVNGATKYRVTCLNNSNGMIATATYFAQGGLNTSNFNNDGTNKYGLCNSTATETLFKVEIWQPNQQNFYDYPSSFYSAITYSEWVNPDPVLNTIEETKITTSWSCADSTGAVRNYSESISKTAAFVAPQCPYGSELIKHDVKAQTGATGEPHTIDSGATAPGTMAAYPDCQFVGCSIQVFLDGTACSVVRVECAKWSSALAQAPSRVVCKWGSYKVPTSDCLSLANAYQSEAGVVYDPRADTWVAVDTYGNPISPNPQPWNPTNPAPAPGVSVANPPAPAPNPTTPGSTFPQTGTNPTTSDNCSAPFWSWNPVEFVKNPVVCALKEAFVPKVDIQARSSQLATKAADTVPISWISTPIVGPSGGGCPNWNINVAGLSKNVVCDSSFTAAIVGSRGPMFTIVASAMIWPLIRGIWYALIPIVRVTPGSSK